MEVVASMKACIKAWIKPTLDRVHQAPPHVIVVRHNDDGEEEAAAEVCAVDLHGNVIKRVQIRQPIVGPVTIHGDLLCASHGWALTSVVNIVTGAATDVGVDHRKKVNSATPYCVLGHVPATGEYKVLRIQADGCSRRRRQMCEVMTLGDAGRWRRRTCPPVTLWTLGAWNVAVVAGHAYFLDCWDKEDNKQPLMADSIAVFDLAAEEWKPLALQGPLTARFLAGTELEEDDDPIMRYIEPCNRPFFLRRNHFQLARVGDSLVVVYCNFKKSLTELWFMEDMADDATMARWSKRYTLRCTPFGDDRHFLQFHYYPLAVLDDGRILVWVDKTCALRAYDPGTCKWTDLATLTRDCVVGMYHGSLLGSTSL